MRVLLLHVTRLRYRAARKVLTEHADDVPEGASWACENASLALVHVVAEDEQRSKAELVRKLRKLVAWHARQVSASWIVLHSFAHLAETSARPDFAREVIYATAEKLRERGFKVHVTPFGWLLELELSLSAQSASRVFKEL